MHFICWDVLVLMFLEGKPLPSVSQRAKQILVVGTTLHFCISMHKKVQLAICYFTFYWNTCLNLTLGYLHLRTVTSRNMVGLDYKGGDSTHFFFLSVSDGRD